MGCNNLSDECIAQTRREKREQNASGSNDFGASVRNLLNTAWERATAPAKPAVEPELASTGVAGMQHQMIRRGVGGT